MIQLITIIVPVYNVSRYLRRCLDSIVNQTLNNIEIIIVNDCSPDPLDDKICREYANSDNRIKYIRHAENKGLGGARNTGLKIATGAYIWFIDSDDFIDINGCEFLYKLTKGTNAEIIAFSATSHIDGSLDLSAHKYYHYHRDVSILDTTMPGKQFIALASTHQSFHVSACLHLFRRSLISQYEFRENVIHEDTDVIPIVIYNSQSVTCTKYAPYYRLLREDSITQKSVTKNSLQDRHGSVESLLVYISQKELGPDDPLSQFARWQFHDALSLCLSAGEEASAATGAFGVLLQRYRSVLEFDDQPNVIYSKDRILKSNNDLRQELDRIKLSRLWRLRTLVLRIRRICGL